MAIGTEELDTLRDSTDLDNLRMSSPKTARRTAKRGFHVEGGRVPLQLCDFVFRLQKVSSGSKVADMGGIHLR